MHVTPEDFKNWLTWQRSRTKLHIIPIIITLLFTVIMMIMIRIIMILLICMFFRIELNIQNSVISWRIRQMAGIGRHFFMIFWTIMFITYLKNQFHLKRWDIKKWLRKTFFERGKSGYFNVDEKIYVVEKPYSWKTCTNIQLLMRRDVGEIVCWWISMKLYVGNFTSIHLIFHQHIPPTSWCISSAGNSYLDNVSSRDIF